MIALEEKYTPIVRATFSAWNITDWLRKTISVPTEKGEPMTRFIDVEWLKTQLYEICDEYNTDRLHIDRIIDEIDDASDADTIDAIRCKNCQSHEPCEVRNRVWCSKMGRYMREDGFCSEGKVKEDG
jgi:hypothetical protein